MRRSLAVALFAAIALVAACHKNQAQNDQYAADMSVIDNNLTAPPADVETLSSGGSVSMSAGGAVRLLSITLMSAAF